jgi:hypothetical protein
MHDALQAQHLPASLTAIKCPSVDSSDDDMVAVNPSLLQLSLYSIYNYDDDDTFNKETQVNMMVVK